MKNNWSFKVLFIVIADLFISCDFIYDIGGTHNTGNGNIVSQERTVEGFNGIALKGIGNINIYFSEKYRIMVTTDSNIQDIVTTEVNNTILYIDEKNMRNFRPTKLVIDVYMPAIQSIALRGVGDIHIDNGKGSDLAIELSGVGNINAQNYQVSNGIVKLTGVGNVKIWAASTLNGSLSGKGNILYKGNPTRNIRTSGLGKVKLM
ncbi:MAG: DUF2807 domain-containing protein [Treponema sp.]|jgi:hypothetical protein|nr:DUF2807 domain-containing protein [Treponema sp.]